MGYATVIDNKTKYAQNLIDDFSDPKKLPQIAISVVYETDIADKMEEPEWKESELESKGFENYKAKAEHYIKDIRTMLLLQS